MLVWTLLAVLVLLLIATLPMYPYSRRWRYYPSGLFCFVIIVILVLILTRLV